MLLLADQNVPEEYVFALRGDGHEVVYTRDVPELGPEAADDAIVAYAESEGYAVLSTDVADFSDRQTSIPVLVAPRGWRAETSVLPSPGLMHCRSIRQRRSPFGCLVCDTLHASVL